MIPYGFFLSKHLVYMMTLKICTLFCFLWVAMRSTPVSLTGNHPGNKLKIIATQVKPFIQSRHFNSSVCFLIDLSENSGRNRFFVFDLQKDSVVDKGLVTHGSCNTLFQSEVKFSNKSGCGCSSSGRYKVGNRYNGRFGAAYKLIGLDSSNSRAYDRAIVLHAHSCVPDKESYPTQICNSQGCTTVSPGFLKKISTLINNSEKPILMWVFQ